MGKNAVSFLVFLKFSLQKVVFLGQDFMETQNDTFGTKRCFYFFQSCISWCVVPRHLKQYCSLGN